MSDSKAHEQYDALLQALIEAGSENPSGDAQIHAQLIYQEHVKSIVKSYLGRLKPGILKELIDATKQGDQLVGSSGQRHSQGAENVRNDALPEEERGEVVHSNLASKEAPGLGRGRKRKEVFASNG